MTPQQLRNSILQMAIEGKLTEQRAEDGNASDLLKEIKAEKAKLIAEKKIKKEKPLPEISEDEIPFEIPDNWCWVRLKELAILENGDRSSRYPTEKDYCVNGIPFIGAKDMNDTFISLKNVRFISEKKFNELGNGKLINKDIVCLLRGTVGKMSIFNESANYKTGFICAQMLIIRFILTEMVLLYYMLMKSPMVKKYISSKVTGTAVRQLPAKEVAELLLPLPPLAEQKRIVARLEEILPQVDEYEKAYNELQELNKKFPDNLKNSLLQMAIEGKLVEQRAEDGNARDLLKEIQAEKAKLIAEKKIKKEKPLPEISEDEIPFEIPDNWVWCKLGMISNYAQPKVKIKPQEITKNMWSLDLEDIEKNTGRIISKISTSERSIKGEKVLFKKGNILYSKLRPYLKKILIADEDGITTPELVPFNIYGDSYQEYFLWYLRSPYVDDTVNSVCYGVKMPRVGTDTMLNLLVPLPPLAEQKRIVAKLEQLLPLCDELGKECK